MLCRVCVCVCVCECELSVACILANVVIGYILIIIQRDATQSSIFIILKVHSTGFGCQPHPSSEVHKTVTTASGIVQLPPSNVAKLGDVGWR